MTLSAAACTTLSALKSALGITVSTYDADLEFAIEAASSSIAGYCGRTLEYGTGIVEKFAGGSRASFALSRTPVASVASITYDGEALTSTDYELEDASAGIVRLLTGPFYDDQIFWSFQPQPVPGTARKLIAITYAGGYVMPAGVSPTLPPAIQQAALSTATAIWRARGRDMSITARSLGKWSESYEIADESGLTSFARSLLAPYRRVVIA